jgi:hypothetical protein
VPVSKLQTKKVIVIVIDGARYTETFGDWSQQHVPFQSQLLPNAVLHRHFYNEGTTNTTNGHAAITTGYYENLTNTGLESPQNPSLFQLFFEATQNPTVAALVCSKDKLEVLKNCKHKHWKDKYLVQSLCGNAGLGTGYCSDSLTFERAKYVIAIQQPDFLVVNFKEPDYSAHTSTWDAYLKGLHASDSLAVALVNFIYAQPSYAGQTAIFITNDHGRHSTNVADGFHSHGCSCEGCRHIQLISMGPDFHKGVFIDQKAGLTDLHATIAYLLKLPYSSAQGRVLHELWQ